MGKRQHYIPQFYLRNFSIDSRKNIGVFRFGKQQFIPNAAIKSVGYRENLYDDDESIERQLASKEKQWKEMLDIFLGRNVTIQTPEWLDQHDEEAAIRVLEFFAFTEMRTTQQADSLTSMYRTLEQELGSKMTPETYNLYFGDLNEFTKHPNLLPLQVASNHLPAYAGLDLLLILNVTKHGFITSDVPVYNLNSYYAERKYHRSFGLAAMGLQKFLPISPRHCLCFFDKNIYEKTINDSTYILTSKNLVRRINQIMVQNAYEQVFFSPIENEQYIRQICCSRKNSDTKSEVIFYGKDKPDLFQMHQENLWQKLLLPCLKIKHDMLKLALPNHMGGLIRPQVSALFQEYNI